MHVGRADLGRVGERTGEVGRQAVELRWRRCPRWCSRRRSCRRAEGQRPGRRRRRARRRSAVACRVSACGDVDPRVVADEGRGLLAYLAQTMAPPMAVPLVGAAAIATAVARGRASAEDVKVREPALIIGAVVDPRGRAVLRLEQGHRRADAQAAAAVGGVDVAAAGVGTVVSRPPMRVVGRALDAVGGRRLRVDGSEGLGVVLGLDRPRGQRHGAAGGHRAGEDRLGERLVVADGEHGALAGVGAVTEAAADRHVVDRPGVLGEQREVGGRDGGTCGDRRARVATRSCRTTRTRRSRRSRRCDLGAHRERRVGGGPEVDVADRRR